MTWVAMSSGHVKDGASPTYLWIRGAQRDLNMIQNRALTLPLKSTVYTCPVTNPVTVFSPYGRLPIFSAAGSWLERCHEPASPPPLLDCLSP